MLNLKLKPCPFCGRDDKLEVGIPSSKFASWFSIDCRRCESTGPRSYTVDGAIRAWNERVEEINEPKAETGGRD